MLTSQTESLLVEWFTSRTNALSVWTCVGKHNLQLKSKTIPPTLTFSVVVRSLLFFLWMKIPAFFFSPQVTAQRMRFIVQYCSEMPDSTESKPLHLCSVVFYYSRSHKTWCVISAWYTHTHTHSSSLTQDEVIFPTGIPSHTGPLLDNPLKGSRVF